MRFRDVCRGNWRMSYSKSSSCSKTSDGHLFVQEARADDASPRAAAYPVGSASRRMGDGLAADRRTIPKQMAVNG